MSSVTSLLPDQNHVGLGHKYIDHTQILGWTSTGRQTQIIFHASACTECSSHSQSCSETWTAEMLCMLWCDFSKCNLIIRNIVKTSLQLTFILRSFPHSSFSEIENNSINFYGCHADVWPAWSYSSGGCGYPLRISVLSNAAIDNNQFWTYRICFCWCCKQQHIPA